MTDRPLGHAPAQVPERRNSCPSLLAAQRSASRRAEAETRCARPRVALATHRCQTRSPHQGKGRSVVASRAGHFARRRCLQRPDCRSHQATALASAGPRSRHSHSLRYALAHRRTPTWHDQASPLATAPLTVPAGCYEATGGAIRAEKAPSRQVRSATAQFAAMLSESGRVGRKCRR